MHKKHAHILLDTWRPIILRQIPYALLGILILNEINLSFIVETKTQI